MGMVRDGKGREGAEAGSMVGTCIFEHVYSANKHLNEAI